MSANHIYYTHRHTESKEIKFRCFFITRFANQYVLRFLLEERKKLTEHDTLTRNTRK